MAVREVQQIMLRTVCENEAQTLETLKAVKAAGYPILKSGSMELGTGNMDPDELMRQALAVNVDAVILESPENWIDKSPIKSLQVSAKFLRQYMK